MACAGLFLRKKKDTEMLLSSFSYPAEMEKNKFRKHKFTTCLQFSSVQSLSRVFLRPHELQHVRPPCPSPNPGVHADSCRSSQ